MTTQERRLLSQRQIVAITQLISALKRIRPSKAVILTLLPGSIHSDSRLVLNQYFWIRSRGGKCDYNGLVNDGGLLV